ncbi:MAG: sulfite exporter TauE/SafE family protein [bacterium]|nr:sulfite exporter TauE/SafE family protein [bacterium]
MSFTDLAIYIVLGAASFINILVPISGSAVVTPFLTILTNPHTAIGLASFYFLLSGVIRVPLFRKDIQWDEVRALLPISLLAAFVGSLSLVVINSTLLLVIVLAFAIYFFLKLIKLIPSFHSRSAGQYITGFIGLFSGFLQGAGLAGSDVRNSYLYGKNLNIAQVHGTSSLIGTSNFLLATIVRLFTNQLNVPDLIPLLYIFPFIALGTFMGRKVLYKLDKKTINIIVAIVMVAIIVFLAKKVITNIF